MGHMSHMTSYDAFAASYKNQVLNSIKEGYPLVPTIIYSKYSGKLVERTASTW
jgi:uroporphyrinogen-III decarboxylase